MKKIIAAIFLSFGLLEIVVLSAVSAFDTVRYSDMNHFWGFLSEYDLWVFFGGAWLLIIIGLIFSFEKEK